MATVEPRGKKRAGSAGKYGTQGTEARHAIDLNEVDGELLRDTMAAVLLEGDAFLVGLTSDQGAVCLRVLSEGGKDAWYPPSTEAFEDTLRAIRDKCKTF